jgi:phage repressor protein C with HTH and peptisase S24 domain
MNFSEILKNKRLSNSLTKAEMALKLGISERMYEYYEKGEYDGSKKRVDKYLDKLAESFDKKKGIPIYNTEVTASNVTPFDDYGDKIIGYIDLPTFRNCVAFMRVSGASMQPRFEPSDFVGLEPMDNYKIIEYGNPFVVITKDRQRLLKIIRKGKSDNHLILRSTNPEYDDIDITKDDILKIFKAKGPVGNPFN